MVAAGADEDAAEGADVSKIAAQSDRNVAFAREEIIGGIEVNPTGIATPELNPGVRSVGADEFGSARRRRGFKIAADVTSGQAESAQAGDLEVGEILANTAALIKYLLQGSSDSGGFGVELEISMNAVRQIESRFEDRATSGKTGGAVFGKSRA